MSQSSRSRCTIVVPCDGTPVSAIEAATRQASNPRERHNPANAIAPGQHVPPTPCWSHASKKSVAARPGRATSAPERKAISLRTLSNGTVRHHRRYNSARPSASTETPSSNPSPVRTRSVSARSIAPGFSLLPDLADVVIGPPPRQTCPPQIVACGHRVGPTGQSRPRQPLTDTEEPWVGWTLHTFGKRDGVMLREQVAGKPTTRRHSDEEKAQTVRLVRQFRRGSDTEQGTVPHSTSHRREVPVRRPRGTGAGTGTGTGTPLAPSRQTRG